MDVKMEDAGAGEGDAVEIAPTKIEYKVEKTPYDMLKQSKGSAEEIVAKLLSLKKEGKPKSHNELHELVTQMVLNFVSLRQANRNILVEEDRVKAETESAKAPVDSTTLQLQNLMYEKNHYLKAIKACTDFKSKYRDIELVSEEEFFSHAPDEIKGAALADDTAHCLMLKRLNFELFQRKELCKLHERLEQQKKSLLGTIANRKKFLSSLPSHLKSLKKASLPVQQQLGVLHTKKQKQQQSTELLPPPLYVIYSQLMAQKESFAENIDLDIIGSVKDAQAFARQLATRETGTSVIQDASKIDDDIPDEEDDDQRRRKRPKKTPGRDILEQTRMYQAHPLRVSLHIYDDEIVDPKRAKLVTLKFEYLVKLNVVCAGIEGSDEGPENSILCHLFPDDAGLELPHQSAKLLLDNAKPFDEKRTLRPYKWAQHLAGIDFLPELSPLLSGSEIQSTVSGKTAVVSGLSLYRQQNRVQTVVQRVRSRKKAQLILTEQLDRLVKLKWPSLSGEAIPWAMHTPLCSLNSWLPLGLLCDTTSNTHKAGVKKNQEMSDANLDGRSEGSKDDTGIIREDGELPSLVPTPVIVNDDKATLSDGSDVNHAKQLALMSKSVITPVKTPRSLSFKKLEDDLYFDSDSDLDEPTKFVLETEDSANDLYGDNRESWVEYGSREFCLVLIRKGNTRDEDAKLEAKVKITKEYPLRPPLFTLNLCYPTSSAANPEDAASDWYNELRAMEAEVNLHILKMLPFEQQNYILSHQVRCLAMLFDFYMNEASQPSEKRKHTSVVDVGYVGLAQPVTGTLLTRSFRGRDRRRMISWKDKVCSYGHPY
ncbi:hypothetical protein V2J09_007148 [Rumex salicifolius]